MDYIKDDHAVEILMKILSFPVIMQCDLLPEGPPEV